MKRYVYVRTSPNSWGIVDTIRAPLQCKIVAFVPEDPTTPHDPSVVNEDAVRFCDVLNRDHEMAVAMGAPPYQGPTQ